MIEWRDVIGFEGRYRVSDDGQVQGSRGMMTPQRKRGYRFVKLWDGESYRNEYVHRLVALAFLDAPSEGEEVRHLNGTRGDDRRDNLAWGSRSENMLDAVAHGTHGMAAIAHCPRGHAYTAENTWRPNDRKARYCRACNRERSSERRLREAV